MWPCPSCGTTNEPHMIFCSACGVMRTKSLPREPRSPLPAEPSSPAPEEPSFAASGPRFRGTAAAFAMRWVGATLGAVFLAWIAQSVLFAVLASSMLRSGGTIGFRLTSILLSTILYGATIGGVQSMCLTRTLGIRVRWLAATIAGYFLGGLASLLQPEGSWQDRSMHNMILWHGFYGLVGGGLTGVFQALALRKVAGPGWMVRWPLVSMGANVLGNVAGIAVWHLLFQGPGKVQHLYLAGFAHSMVDAFLTAAPAGLVLGLGLRRQLGAAADDESE